MYTTQQAADNVRLDGHDLWPYRHLAVRVLAAAFADLEDPVKTPADRESARLFLAGSDLFQHWCRVADFNPECVTRYAERLTRCGWESPAQFPRSVPLRQQRCDV